MNSLNSLTDTLLSTCFVGYLGVTWWGRVASTSKLGSEALAHAFNAVPAKWLDWVRRLSWSQRRHIGRMLCHAPRPLLQAFLMPGGDDPWAFCAQLGANDAVWRRLSEMRLGVTKTGLELLWVSVATGIVSHARVASLVSSLAGKPQHLACVFSTKGIKRALLNPCFRCGACAPSASCLLPPTTPVPTCRAHRSLSFEQFATFEDKHALFLQGQSSLGVLQGHRSRGQCPNSVVAEFNALVRNTRSNK